MKNTATDAEIIAAAREQYEDEGTLEIDDAPAISRVGEPDDRGAYVAAWVWVEFEDDDDDDDH